MRADIQRVGVLLRRALTSTEALVERMISMAVKSGKPAPKAPPATTVKLEIPADALAEIRREIARIQKKLGMDVSWYKG